MADPKFTIRLQPNGSIRLCVNGHVAAWARTRLIVTEQTEQSQLIGSDCLEVPWWELAPIFPQLGSIQRLFPELHINADEGTRAIINKSREALEQIVQPRDVIPVAPTILKEVLQQVGFIRPLTEKQLRNVGKLTALSSGATFSVPGAGKTTEALATFAFKTQLNCRLLVVCPKNAFTAWEEQTAACLPQLSVTRLTGGYFAIEQALATNPRLAVITYSQLTNVRDLIAKHLAEEPSVMFLDESHKIKGGEHRAWASAVLSVSHLPMWKLIMSGTPMPNVVDDLVPQIRFLYPGIASGEDPVPIIQRIHVRTTKTELDLPPVECTGIPIPMTDAQARLYNLCAHEVARDADALIKSVDKNALRSFGKSYMLLLQLVSNPALLAAYQGRFNNRDLIECLQSDSPKVAYVCHRARQLVAQGNKVLIWSGFVQNVEIISERLSDLGADYIHGDVEAGSEEDEQTREFKIARFHREKDDAMVLVANPAACSEGISLHQVCHHALYVDRNYNAAQFLQSQDRIHRYGLPKEIKTFIEYVYCPNTIDESVNRRLQAKVDRMQQVLKDPSINMPTHWLDDLDELPDAEDIRDLLQMLKGNRGMTAIHSVGTLYAIQDLFTDLESRQISADEFRLCFIKFGTSTAKDIYETATALNWICTSSGGEIVPTMIGKAAHPFADRAIKLRFQLRSIIENTYPPWAALLVNGRKEASLAFPVEIRQCFKEALLFETIDDDVINWWDQLSACMREEAAMQRMQIGRAGERLTLRFELERTGKKPKWQAFETNFAGYDVLSIQNSGNPRHLKIEVKASIRRFKEAFINVTEHEWITAQIAPDDYIFYVWILNENEATQQNSLFIIPTSEIASHIPSNQGNGVWKQAAIRIGAVTHPSKAQFLND